MEKFIKIVSPARFHRFYNSTNQNEEKALELYKLNVRLSSEFHIIHSFFEIALRNAINLHYKEKYEIEDWILQHNNVDYNEPIFLNSALQIDNFKASNDINQVIADLNNKKITITNDKIVSNLSFSFWVYMFAEILYRLGGKTLLRIFPAKPIKRDNNILNQRQIFRDLFLIKNWRNRFSHFESLVFDNKEKEQISTKQARYIYYLIKSYMEYLEVYEIYISYIGKDNIENICDEIDKIQKELTL